jgi:hypothetical protein
MNLKELQTIIELAKSYSADLPANIMIYTYKIYLPVSEAIAENNKAVIGYLLNCNTDDRITILNAIEDGAERLNTLKAFKLLGMVKKDRKYLNIMANA